MRASSVFAAALSVAAVSAYYGNDTKAEYTTTEVVTQYTTYCPYPTTIVENNQTYVVTEPTTLTISNCPCTRTLTYTTVTETHCPGGCQKPTDAPTYPNGTTTYAPPSPPPPPTEYPTVPNVTYPVAPPESEGGAIGNQATLVGGALAALVGVVAYLL